MIWLIGHLLSALVLIALCAALLGWFWWQWRTAPEAERLRLERVGLLKELVGRVRASRGLAGVDPDREDEQAFERASLERQAQRVATLERELEAAKADANDVRLELDEARSALTARQGAFLEVEELRDRCANLEQQLSHAGKGPGGGIEIDAAELSLLRGRAAEVDRLQRDLMEARRREQQSASLPALVSSLQAQLQESEHTRGAAEAARRGVASELAVMRQNMQRLQWRLRYFERRDELKLGADAGEQEARKRAAWRLRYLESRNALLEDAFAEATREGEFDLRRRWRLEYLDRRLGWIIDRSRAAVIAADEEAEQARSGLTKAETARTAALGEAEDLRIRVADLQEAVLEAQARAAQQQAALRTVTEERDAALLQAQETQQAEAGNLSRLRWKTAYLQERVEQLETMLLDHQVAAGAPAPPLPPTTRPAALPAAPVVHVRAPSEPLPSVQPPPPAPPGPAARPPRLAAPRNGAPDDLRLIPGITPQIHSKLNASGIYHFDQIAGWSSLESAWVDRYLALRGQIERDDWVRQAGRLARGEPALKPEDA